MHDILTDHCIYPFFLFQFATVFVHVWNISVSLLKKKRFEIFYLPDDKTSRVYCKLFIDNLSINGEGSDVGDSWRGLEYDVISVYTWCNIHYLSQTCYFFCSLMSFTLECLTEKLDLPRGHFSEQRCWYIPTYIYI